MKAKNTITAILISILSIVSFTISAAQVDDHFTLQEEAYIDDIPFNTAKIFDNMQQITENPEVATLADEAYIDDIPFNTAKVVADYRCCVAMHVKYAMQPEKSIDDIPFDTYKIARAVRDHASLFATGNLVSR